MRLRQRFGLAHHANVVFQRKNFAQAGAENGLRIGHDHTDELAVAVVFVRLQIVFTLTGMLAIGSLAAPYLARNDTHR